MVKHKNILWITRTAVFTALLIVIQAATAPLNVTLVTGSLVNLILILSVMTCGLLSGLTVAALSPFFAKLLGIGPAFWTLIPFIALGNIVLVFVWHLVANRRIVNSMVSHIMALVLAAVLKFLMLYAGIVMIAVPVLMGLPEKQASVLSATFSFPQLITASIGGAVAMLILPTLKKALGSPNRQTA